jgi:hypothetical protein
LLRSNFVRFERKAFSLTSSDASTVVAGRFKFAFILESLSAGSPPFSHFDPFGTEFCVSRGGSAILSEFRIADFGIRICTTQNPLPFQSTISNLQRSFQPTPHFRDFATFGFELLKTHYIPIRNPKSEMRNYKDPSNLRRNSWRPRASLDLTVPTLIPRVAAISS